MNKFKTNYKIHIREALLKNYKIDMKMKVMQQKISGEEGLVGGSWGRVIEAEEAGDEGHGVEVGIASDGEEGLSGGTQNVMVR